MNKPVLILMTRWPAAGRCKRRLAADLGITKAALIQKHLTDHTIEVAKTVEEKGLLEINIAISGLGSNCAKKWGLKHGIKKAVLQGEGSLGLRMRKQIIRVQRHSKYSLKKGRATIIIGSDVPGLCEHDLIEAIDFLKTYEMVIGPASDGGYWLIGLSGKLINPVVTWPFSGIPWGTSNVLNKTILKANLSGTDHILLRQQKDLDQIKDLSPWLA